MKKITQFTYSYTKYKYGLSGFNYGDGVFNMTAGSNDNDKKMAGQIIMGIRQDFPDKDINRGSFGYIYREDNPLIFNSFIRRDDMVITDRPGVGPYYAAHVSVGELLFDDCYAIEYFNGGLKNTDDHFIDDSKKPEPYEELTESDLDAGRNPMLSPNALFEGQCDNLSALALLVDAILTAVKQNKRVFLRTDEMDNDTVADWIAMALMLLPKCIANKISFCTYAPNPTDGRFTICGVSKENEYEALENYGYVFDVGATALNNNYQPNENSDLYLLLSSLNSDSYQEWLSFLDAYADGKDISIDELNFAASLYRINIDDEIDIHEKIQLLNKNCQSPYNRNKFAQSLFVLLCDDTSIMSQLCDDEELAYAYVEGMKLIICDATTDLKYVNESFNKIFFFMLENRAGSHYIFERIIDKQYSLATFFGNRTRSAEEGLLAYAETVKETVKSNFGISDGLIDKKILICLINIFIKAALTSGGIAREVLDLCTTKLIEQNGLEHLMVALKNSSGAKYISLAKFLLELRNEASILILDEDSCYRERLFKELTSRHEEYKTIVNQYAAIRPPKLDVCKHLLHYNWDVSNLNLEKLILIFEERDSYRYVRPLFDEHYIKIFEDNIDNILKRETEAASVSTYRDIEKKKNDVENLISMFNSYAGDPRIRSFVSKLTPFFEIIKHIKHNDERANVAKTMRIKYIASEIYEIPKKDVIKLFKKFNITTPTASDNLEFMQDAEKELKNYLNSDSKSATLEEKKSFCNELDKLIDKNRARYATAKSGLDSIIDLVTAIVLMVSFSILTTSVSEFIFYGLFNGFGALIKGVFPVMAAIYVGSMFFVNRVCHQRVKRVIISSLEAACLVAMMFTAYYGLIVML